MPSHKHLRLLLRLLCAALAAVLAWVLLPALLPFLIALCLSAALERPLLFLMRRLGLRRWIAAALCTLALTLTLGAGTAALLWRLWCEAAALTKALPTMLAALPAWGEAVERFTYKIIVAAPIPVQDALRTAAKSVAAQGASVPSALYTWLVGFLGGIGGAMPRAALFLFTTLLALYFTCARRPEILARLAALIPARHRGLAGEVKARSLKALGGWLRVQGILLVVTFCTLAVALPLLGAELPLLAAAGTALLDALPVFGVGAVLLPWAAVSLFARAYGRGLGLLGLYAALCILRSILEPKLMGDHAGLPPLAALAAMYAGFHFFGLLGMILAPLAAILVRQLRGAGIGALFRGED